MMDNRDDAVEFDDLLTMALAGCAPAATPRAGLKGLILARATESDTSRPDPLPEAPAGFSFRYGADSDWMAHPVPGIRMKVLALNPKSGYATLLLDVAPGTRFPAHAHTQAEECYVLSGSLFTCGRRLAAGDFVHADAGTEHGELWTEEGCRVILVAEPEDYMISRA